MGTTISTTTLSPNSTSPSSSPSILTTTSPSISTTTLSSNSTCPSLSPTTFVPTTLSPTPNSSSIPTIPPGPNNNDNDTYSVGQVFSFMVISGILVFTFFMMIKFRVHVYFFLRETWIRCKLSCNRLFTRDYDSNDNNSTSDIIAPLNEVIFDPTDGGGSSSNDLQQPLIDASNMAMGSSETL